MTIFYLAPFAEPVVSPGSPVTNVTMTPTPTDFSWSASGANVTVEGTYTSLAGFGVDIDYLNASGQKQVVETFDQLPVGYQAVTKLSPPDNTSVGVTVNITYTVANPSPPPDDISTTVGVPVNVLYNYTAVIPGLKSAVAAGQF